MAKDYYDDAPSTGGDSSAATEAAPQPDEGKGDETQGTPEENAEPTDLVNKALLAGKDFKVGDEVVFKIVGFHGDQVEVQYATEKGGKGDEEGEGEGENDAMGKMYS